MFRTFLPLLLCTGWSGRRSFFGKIISGKARAANERKEMTIPRVFDKIKGNTAFLRIDKKVW